MKSESRTIYVAPATVDGRRQIAAELRLTVTDGRWRCELFTDGRLHSSRAATDEADARRALDVMRAEADRAFDANPILRGVRFVPFGQAELF